ncbi:DUF935 family protein [Campylobacter hyointestinalis subsp. hyointestinalis]|uniref:phage portal protein family protein n=1 Tax=Campylobacter hyointestinalis TaxID=198 RepID=UPI0010FFA01D|nr:DUF935 family protein [Campylobacter hyointestinalis]QCT99349.1 DUF935 family protein [Campylobacter hyointestinalis subsp. hyointestinalis]
MKFLNIFKNKQETKKSAVLTQNGTLIEQLINTGVSSISDSDIDMILTDLTVTQCDVSRKAVTEKKEIQIISDDEDVKEEFERIFNPDIVSQILETYLYGLNVFEVNYKQKESLFYPRLVQRDFRHFKFNDEGEFVFNANGTEQIVPPFKAIYALNRANFRKVYGDGLLKKLYFPVKMKNASLKFWFRFLERFGSPWAVAKTDYDAQGLANEVHAMLAGDSAVIDKDEEITLIQPTANIDFSRLPDYFDNQISKAILGANLTSDVKEGSLAASKTHNEIREDLAANDAKILIFVMNKAISFFKDINGFTGELYAKLYDEDAPNLERAQRDEILYNMGFAPTPEYVKATYNIELDENESVGQAGRRANKASTTDKPKFLDKFDVAMEDKKLNTALYKLNLEGKLDEILSRCDTYEQAFTEFSKLYENAPLEELEETMFKAVTNSGLAGFSDEI